MKRILIIGLVAAIAAGAALAQQPPAPAGQTPPASGRGGGRGGGIVFQPPVPGPSAALALEAVQKIVATCKANGFNVAAVVVDSGGNMRAQLTGDGTDPRAPDFGLRKAYTAAKLGMTPGEAAAKVRSDQAYAAEIAAKVAAEVAAGGQRLNVGNTGGLPIKVGDRVIGGISASGAPQAAQDDACAQAGLDAIKGRLN